MMTPTRVKIGFVPTLRGGWGPVSDWCARMREEGIRFLQQIDGLELVYPRPHPEDPSAIVPEGGYVPGGVVCNLDHAEAVAAYFAREKVDGIVIGALNFGDERSASKIAELLKVPVMVYATKEPPVPEGPSLARISDSYCGTLSIAAGLYRRKLPFHFAGILLADEPAFRHEAEVFLRAVAVVKSLMNARIGQIGLRPSGFETVAYDEKAMIQKFGQNVIYLDLADLVHRAREYPDEDPRLAEITQRTRQSVAQITVAEEWLQKAARLELSIREFWQNTRLSAMAMSCWPSIQRMYGISVCAIFGKLTSDGLLTACEADVIGALSMLTQHAASLHQAIPHFIDWTIQHRDHPNRFLAWHCGNAPTCLAADPSRTALRSRQDMLGVLPPDPCDDQAGLYQFQLRPGPVTLCRLAEYDGQWKMLIASGEIIPSDETLTGTWAWVQVRDHHLLYRTLVEEGFIHHASLIHGNQRDSLLLACKFLDIRPVLIE